MSYELYLFSCLLKLFDFDFDEKPYDEQFDLLPDKFKKFENSHYNDPTIPVYDCIVNYLKDDKNL